MSEEFEVILDEEVKEEIDYLINILKNITC